MVVVRVGATAGEELVAAMVEEARAEEVRVAAMVEEVRAAEARAGATVAKVLTEATEMGNISEAEVVERRVRPRRG